MRAAVMTLCAALALAGCGQKLETSVTAGWVRLPAVPRQPAAAYFTLNGGPADMTLVNVTCENAIRSEMHESVSVGGRMSMRRIAEVALPAKSHIKFAPGGKHVMLFDLNPAIKPGRAIPLMFTFSNGERIILNAASVAAGDPAPKT